MPASGEEENGRKKDDEMARQKSNSTASHDGLLRRGHVEEKNGWRCGVE